ncbi:GDP-mannose 4,6-dehydratase [Candidatus Nomurabacteria bacterium]|nr:GDP-mannose 4,6-dehydratase [Candidatus Nomurabacteria bacterium]
MKTRNFKKPKTIIVTGCAGFIGSNFVKVFKKEFPKTNIVGIDDLSTGKIENISNQIKFYKKSILNEKEMEKIFKEHKPEYIFHFAALPRVSYSIENPIKTSEINITGTIILLEKSKKYKIKRFILSSSSSIYGGAKKMPTSENNNQPNPKSPYALQKYVDEQFCKLFSDLFEMETIALRYFNVFGPGQYGKSAYTTVISGWLESIYFPKNKKGFIEGDGSQTRDFCFVENIVFANICAMKATGVFKGEIFNIGNNIRISLKEVKEKIEKYTNKKLELEKRPSRFGDVKHTHADIKKAMKYLKYKPLISFSDGLKKTIEWFEMRRK